MRIRLEIAYHGAGFEGWQSQAGGNTIQDHIEKAFETLCGGRIIVHGAGRTDSGVHAEAQSAHADVPDDRLDLRAWRNALNAHLPESIRVMLVEQASEDFHARFSAKGKIYRYTIWNNESLNPLEKDRAWHVPQKLDWNALQEACELFTGTHDFAAFSLRRSNETENTIRTITAIEIDQHGPKIQLTFKGSGFLYKMVRILTAAIIRRASGKTTREELANSLNNGTPAFLHVAPAQGLCLMKVEY